MWSIFAERFLRIYVSVYLRPSPTRRKMANDEIEPKPFREKKEVIEEQLRRNRENESLLRDAEDPEKAKSKCIGECRGCAKAKSAGDY